MEWATQAIRFSSPGKSLRIRLNEIHSATRNVLMNEQGDNLFRIHIYESRFYVSVKEGYHLCRFEYWDRVKKAGVRRLVIRYTSKRPVRP